MALESSNRSPIYYPLFVGILLGVFQSGLFVSLTFTLSSGFTTYLLITLCWLIGGILGASYFSKLNFSLRSAHIKTLVAYVLCILIINLNPFNTALWPLYGLLIGVVGVYPGVFFARTSRHYSARKLFFWENNGFIIGLSTSTLIFMLYGRVGLWTLILAMNVLVWWLCPTFPHSLITVEPAASSENESLSSFSSPSL